MWACCAHAGPERQAPKPNSKDARRRRCAERAAEAAHSRAAGYIQAELCSLFAGRQVMPTRSADGFVPCSPPLPGWEHRAHIIRSYGCMQA